MIRRSVLICACAFSGLAAAAETVVAARTIRAGEVIGSAHLTVAASTVPGAVTDPERLIGLEARRMIYAGRPVLMSDIGAPAIVERNAVVPLLYRHGGLTITSEGRVLSRAGAGDRIRVLNLTSRKTVHGVVSAAGTVIVDGSE